MSEKVITQLNRVLQKTIQKYPATDEPASITDIHIRINQETGDVMVFDDDDKEITRVVVNEWINNNDDEDVFFKEASDILSKLLLTPNDKNIPLGKEAYISQPYSYVLENEQGEHISELFVADEEETIIIGESLMEGWDKDLDDFLKHLLEE